MERLRQATDSDWHAAFGFRAPDEWVGLVAESPWMLYGIGGVWKDGNGVWWMFFWRAPGVRMTKTAHAAARIMVDVMREANIQVQALADRRICGSSVWLRRLGFVETNITDETIKDHLVWTLPRKALSQRRPLP